MASNTTQVTAQTEIRGLIENWTGAVRRQDVDRIASFYAGEVRAFDAVSRLEFRGKEAYMAHWASCFALCPGPTVFELDHLEIEVAGDLAFSHALNRCGGTGSDGQVKTSWMRSTACYRRTGDTWQIVHEHFSIPFDMQTGAALFELTP